MAFYILQIFLFKMTKAGNSGEFLLPCDRMFVCQLKLGQVSNYQGEGHEEVWEDVTLQVWHESHGQKMSP